MQALSFQVERQEGSIATLVRAVGYIDTHTANQLEELLEAQIDTGATTLVLELGGVDYVSSAGWGVLISSVRRARHLGGDLVLVGMRPEVADVFELLEFPSIMRAYDALEEALTAHMN